MAVTYNNPIQVGPYAWRLSWTSDQENPTYRVYRNGREVHRGSLNTATVTLQEGESATVEVLDDDAAVAESIAATSHTLHWAASTGAVAYRVERKISGEWTLEHTLRAGNAETFAYRTPALADAETHEYRVKAVGADGNQGTAATLDIPMVRTPDPPEVDYSYSSGTGKVTISEAA